MRLNRYFWRIGLNISQYYLDSALVYAGWRKQSLISHARFSHNEQDKLAKWVKSIQQKTDQRSLSVYVTIDEVNLVYKSLVLPSVMSFSAVKHYLSSSAMDLLGGSQDKFYYDFCIRKMSDSYWVDLYGLAQSLYDYCFQKGRELGLVKYMGPSDWVQYQYLQRWLPLSNNQGYIFTYGGWRYYWSKDGQGHYRLQPISQDDDRVWGFNDVNWYALPKSLPAGMRFLRDKEQASLAAVIASL